MNPAQGFLWTTWRMRAGTALVVLCTAACGESSAASCPPPTSPVASGAAERRIADALHTVLSIDREVYTVEVVERLQHKEHVLEASHHYVERKTLPIPAVLFRLGAERARKRTDAVSYGLVSPWPINKDNTAKTPAEREGLETVIRVPQQPHYAEEVSATGQRQLIAVYPDVAVSQACIDCHSRHPESPRHDFMLGEVMGAMVVRVAFL